MLLLSLPFVAWLGWREGQEAPNQERSDVTPSETF
jgi:hypothetical protein